MNAMRINLNHPERGDIAFKQFTFPDGQPHCEFDPAVIAKAADAGPIDVIASIQSGNDLLGIGIALEALRSLEKSSAVSTALKIRLNISYLLGARMDRRIAPGQPDTLSVVARVVNGWATLVDEIRVLDVHSAVAATHLPNLVHLYPDTLLSFALTDLALDDASRPTIVIPDAGAVPRVEAMMKRLALSHPVARCVKKRDSQTGKLSGFELVSGDVQGATVIIVDDICDGGGTFAGIAKTLRAAGAAHVVLCVTHGVFSKGFRIEGVDAIYCTDSYRWNPDASAHFVAATRQGNDVLLLKHEEGGEGKVVLTRLLNYTASLV
jgi:ribose-phosphate pyrophosphokinase